MNFIPSLGSLVRLRSGGPLMTVWGMRQDNIVQVEWFVNDELHRDAFNKDELELYQKFQDIYPNIAV